MSTQASAERTQKSNEQLPFRLEGRLAGALGIKAGVIELRADEHDALPRLRCVLPKPVSETVSLVLRVHSLAGIPLASAPIEVKPGDQGFEAHLVMLAMEGYAHLDRAERQIVERRVWSRRAFVTGSAV